jgi:hypothetical protein
MLAGTAIYGGLAAATMFGAACVVGVAHDFKNILAAVDGYAEIAGDRLTVELAARKTIHPALSDLLIEAAQEVHGKSTIMQRAGQFPNPTARDFPISDDAIRYFRSGKSFLYRTLPFWLASVTDRMLLLIVPAVRSIPLVYRWRVRSRIHRVYGRLLTIERKTLLHAHHDCRSSLLDELNTIEKSLDAVRPPLSHVDSLYILREHVGLVRLRLGVRKQEASNVAAVSLETF